MNTLIVVAVILLILAMAVKPLRKTMGLLIVLLGFIACLSVVGLILEFL